MPVIVRNDLTPDEIKAARLADNKLAESDWDNDFLSSEMIELYDAEFPIDILGFSPSETAQLFGIELDAPNFDPASIDEQGKLDEKKKVTCPGCGHEFTP